LVVQIQEAGGELWVRRFDLGSLAGQRLDIALYETTFEPDDKASSDAHLDLGRIDQIGFRVNGLPGGKGMLYVDGVLLVRRGT
jgi:hypothetical protein